MIKENNNFVLVVGLILALFLLVAQSYMLTDDNDSGLERSISVSGKSEMTVTPDLAEIHISIKTENDDAQVAQSENKVLSAKVIDALKDYGISEKDIETQNFRLNENYKYDLVINNIKDDESKEELKYQVVHTLKVKCSDLKKIGEVVDLVIGAGANGVGNIDYTLSDDLEKEVRAKALEMAIVAGKEKAKSMSDNLDVSLGKVVKISENNYYFSPYSFAANVKAESFDNTGGSLNYLSPHSVEVQSSVNLEFEIK